MLFAGHIYVGLYVLYIFVQVEGELVYHLLVIHMLDCMFCTYLYRWREIIMLFSGHTYVGLCSVYISYLY